MFGSTLNMEVALLGRNLSTMLVARDNVARGCGLCVVDFVWFDAQGNITYCDGSECPRLLSMYSRRLLQASAYALFLVFSEAEYHPTFNETCAPPCVNFTVRSNARIVYDPAMKRRDVAHLIEEYFAPAQTAAASISPPFHAKGGFIGGGVAVAVLIAAGCVVRLVGGKKRVETTGATSMFVGVTIDVKKGG